MMPIVIMKTGPLVTLRDDRWAPVAERWQHCSVGPIMTSTCGDLARLS
jgi:hypothetical protein